jgi:hypothetical protein
MAEKAALNAASLSGSGPGGRIVSHDVIAANQHNVLNEEHWQNGYTPNIKVKLSLDISIIKIKKQHIRSF